MNRLEFPVMFLISFVNIILLSMRALKKESRQSEQLMINESNAIKQWLWHVQSVHYFIKSLLHFPDHAGRVGGWAAAVGRGEQEGELHHGELHLGEHHHGGERQPERHTGDILGYISW